jgi:ribosomal protein L21E
MCKCGCNTCETKGPLLTEGKVKSLLSEGLQYHIDKKIPLFETVYRIGSNKHLSLIKEARKMYSRNVINLCEEDEALIKTHLGEFGLFCEIEMGDKVKASKEYGGQSGEVVDIKGSFIVVKTKKGNKSYHESDLKVLNKEGIAVPLDLPMLNKEEIEEAEFKGKDVPLNKPKRGGPKAYYVYVKDGDKVKKVTFGSGGLRAKIKNKEARNAFAARHNCKDKKDRTKPGYWSCNLPRYAQALGLGANMNTFWSLLWMIVLFI